MFNKDKLPFVGNQEGIKEVLKAGVRSTTDLLPALFIRSPTLCIPLKAVPFFLFLLILLLSEYSTAH